MRYGSIYKITCLINDKIYIGQTVQNPPIKRWLDHYDEMNRTNNQLLLYRALRRWGIENFTFQILEENIELSKLNEKEIYYITKFKSNQKKYGYNLTRGGQLSTRAKLDESKVREIIDYIKNENEKTFVDIAKIFGVSREMISDINTGETWYFKTEHYPIRDNSNFKNKLTEDDVYDIYDLLRRNVSLSEIAKEYNVSITNISNINRGKIYKFLDESNYPVYKPVNSKTRLGLEKAEKIIKMLISSPEYTYSKIGDIVGVGRKTVSGINNGKLYVDLASKLGVYKYPIR